jgi:flavodoxin
MNALVLFESVYGNTRAVAEAIAEGLGGAEVVSVHDAGEPADDVELLVVGAPTHIHGLPTKRSIQAGADAASGDGGAHVEPDATEDPNMRAWLGSLPRGRHGRVAVFDTRLDKPTWFTGAASRGIAKRLRQHGYDVVATESFLVTGSEGPLEPGELDRARSWGRELARSVLTAV